MTDEQIDTAIATFADSTLAEKNECWAVCWRLQDAACEAIIVGRYTESKRLFAKAQEALQAYFKVWG